MKLKPIPQALGMNPLFWGRFTFVSVQVHHDEKRSHEPRVFRSTVMRRAQQLTGVANRFGAARKILDAQPVPMDNRQVR